MSPLSHVLAQLCFLKKNTTASRKMYAFLTDLRREKTLGYILTFYPHQNNFGWEVKLAGKLSSGRNFTISVLIRSAGT